MKQHIPCGPWSNPRCNDGLYSATIENIQYQQRGDDEMLEITQHLDEDERYIVTRLYMPAEFSAKCQHRLWYFCQSIGVEPHELIENPEVAVGRQLMIEITTIHPTTANHGKPYSDVKRFLPAKECDQNFEDLTTNAVS